MVLFIQPKPIEALHDLADTMIDERDLTEIVAQGVDVVGQQQRPFELLPHPARLNAAEPKRSSTSALSPSRGMECMSLSS